MLANWNLYSSGFNFFNLSFVFYFIICGQKTEANENVYCMPLQ